jgi:hypothetical protein
MVCKNMIGHYKTKTKWQNIKFNGVFKVVINRKKNSNERKMEKLNMAKQMWQIKKRFT